MTKHQLSYEYSDGGRTAEGITLASRRKQDVFYFTRQRADCTVRALAHLTGKTYRATQRHMVKHAEAYWNGLSASQRRWWSKSQLGNPSYHVGYRALGIRYIDGKITAEAAYRKYGDCIGKYRGHVFAIVGGVVKDTGAAHLTPTGRSKQLHGVWVMVDKPKPAKVKRAGAKRTGRTRRGSTTGRDPLVLCKAAHLRNHCGLSIGDVAKVLGATSHSAAWNWIAKHDREAAANGGECSGCGDGSRVQVPDFDRIAKHDGAAVEGDASELVDFDRLGVRRPSKSRRRADIALAKEQTARWRAEAAERKANPPSCAGCGKTKSSVGFNGSTQLCDLCYQRRDGLDNGGADIKIESAVDDGSTDTPVMGARPMTTPTTTTTTGAGCVNCASTQDVRSRGSSHRDRRCQSCHVSMLAVKPTATARFTRAQAEAVDAIDGWSTDDQCITLDLEPMQYLLNMIGQVIRIEGADDVYRRVVLRGAGNAVLAALNDLRPATDAWRQEWRELRMPATDVVDAGIEDEPMCSTTDAPTAPIDPSTPMSETPAPTEADYHAIGECTAWVDDDDVVDEGIEPATLRRQPAACGFCYVLDMDPLACVDSKSRRQWKRDCDRRSPEDDVVDINTGALLERGGCDAYLGKRSTQPCMPCELVDVYRSCVVPGCSSVVVICRNCAELVAFQEAVEAGCCSDHVDQAAENPNWREDYGLPTETEQVVVKPENVIDVPDPLTPAQLVDKAVEECLRIDDALTDAIDEVRETRYAGEIDQAEATNRCLLAHQRHRRASNVAWQSLRRHIDALVDPVDLDCGIDDEQVDIDAPPPPTSTQLFEYKYGPDERVESVVDRRFGVDAEVRTSTWVLDDGTDGRSSIYVHVDGCANTDVDHTHPLTGGRFAGFMTTWAGYIRGRGRCSDCAAGRPPWSAAPWAQRDAWEHDRRLRRTRRRRRSRRRNWLNRLRSESRR